MSRKILNIFLFSFLFFIFFFRTSIVQIPTLLITSILLFFLFLDKEIINLKTLRLHYHHLDVWYYLFLLNICVVFIMNSLFYFSLYKYTIIFLLEFTFNILVFYYFYFMYIKHGDFTDRVFKYLIIGAVTYPVPAIFILAYVLESVRRIGAADAHVITAVNHLGHALSISAIILFINVVLKKQNKLWNIIIFVVIITAAILTGSRAAILALIINIGFVIFLKKNAKSNIFLVFSIFVVFAYFMLGDLGKFENLFNRLSFDMIMLGFQNRIIAFTDALKNFSFNKHFLFGVGWNKYELLGAVDDYIPYPHNIIISIFTMFGLPAAIVFTVILVKEWMFLFKICIRKVRDSEFYIAVILFSAFNSVLIYSLTSGRLTRIITIFCILGLVSALRYRISVRNKR